MQTNDCRNAEISHNKDLLDTEAPFILANQLREAKNKSCQRFMLPSLGG